MTMSVEIRRGEREDAYELLALAHQYQTGRERIGKDEFLVSLDNVLRPREHETNVLFVATINQLRSAKHLDGQAADIDQSAPRRAVVGYSLLSVSRLLHAPGLTGHLQEVVVDEEYRNRGIGEALMRVNESYCQQRGVRQLSASTARMGSFFNHRGFEVVGEHFRKILDLG